LPGILLKEVKASSKILPSIHNLLEIAAGVILALLISKSTLEKWERYVSTNG
jgi:hypothetical protein